MYYREGSGVRFGKKSGLSKVADIECIFCPEDVQIVSVLMSENWRQNSKKSVNLRENVAKNREIKGLIL